MNKFYEEFKSRLENSKQSANILYCSNYFEVYLKQISEEDMYNILNYDKRTFKNYVDFIIKLRSQRKLNNNLEVIHELTKLIFSLKSMNNKLLTSLILETDIIYNKDILKFAREFTVLSYNKAILVYNAVLENENKLSLMKLVTYINYLKNDEQVNSIEKLFQIPGIFKHPDLYKFIDLIVTNNNSKYLGYIPVVLHNNNLLENKNCYQLVSLFLKVTTDEQASLLYKILKNDNMINSYALKITISYLLDNKNHKNLKYLNYIVDLKYCISDFRFFRLIELYKQAGTCEFKINGLTGLFATKRFLTYENNNSSEYLDDYQFELMASYILKTKTRFQVAAIIGIVRNIKKDDLNNHQILLFLDKIIECKKDYQANLIVELLKAVTTSKYLYNSFFNPNNDSKNCYENKIANILDLINTIKDKKATDKFILVIENPYVMENKDYINIIKKYIVLDDEKYEYYCDMILKKGLLDNNNYLAFDCLKLANKLQAFLIRKVIMETDIYLDNQEYELIKYLLATKDRKSLYYITAVIFNRKSLGLDEAKECIENVIKNKDISNLNNNNNNKQVINVYNGILRENITFRDKVENCFKKNKIK